MRATWTSAVICILGSLLGLGFTGTSVAQPAYRVKDIKTTLDFSLGVRPYGFVSSGPLAYFVGSDPVHGGEVWRTDGTAAGTFLLRDILPGDALSPPGLLVGFGGEIFFGMFDPAVGTELWKSDGTTSGTVLVKDIHPNGSSSPAGLTNSGGTLFFAAGDGVNGIELWKTDGTAAGTEMVKDINPAGDSSPSDLVDVNGTLFFEAFGDVAQNRELWKSDGTAAGTVLVKDVRSGPAEPFLDHFTNVGGTLFFNADDGVRGKELWKSDGTAAGTVLVLDIYLGSMSSDPKALLELNGVLLFTAHTSSMGRELFKSDGTGPGTVLVKDIHPAPFTGSFPANDPPRLAKAGTTAFLVAEDGTNGNELWKSDGTSAGTVLVADICPGACSSIPSTNAAGLAEVILTEVSGTLFFSANGGSTGEELWKSDGTAPGTVLVKDIRPGASTSFTTTSDHLVASHAGMLFFGADDGTNGREVWKSDGTEPGTVMVKNPSTTSSSPSLLTLVSDLLFFRADDGGSGTEIWKSDGTDAGTVLVKDIQPGSVGAAPLDLIAMNGALFFTADDGGTLRRELWKSDGSAGGTVLVKDIHPWPGWSSNPSKLTNVNGTLFLAADDGSVGLGSELWKSDGTGPGTTMVKDIFPGSSSSTPAELMALNGTLFFRANDGSTGTELWKSDGTNPGTVRVKDLSVGVSSSNPMHLTNVNGTLFLVADAGGLGRELWKSDGTDAGTVLVKETCPGFCGGFTNLTENNFLVDVNGILFFTADDGVNGRELWKSDGTSVGTVLVKDITPGTNFRGPFSLTPVNGVLLFFTTDNVNGAELWRSDGTAAGTVRVTDISPGQGAAIPFLTPAAGAAGEILFAATDSSSGVELWKSGGSAASTLRVHDISTGSPASLPTAFRPATNLVYFTADDGSGRELWALGRTNVAVAKTDSSDPALTGSGLIYTLTATNQGPIAANLVTVTDTLPLGMSFVSSQPGAPTCTQTAGVVTCSLGTLAAGASRNVRIAVTPSVVGTAVNVATAVAAQMELDFSNNEALETTDVEAGCVSAPSFGGLVTATNPTGCDAILTWNPATGICPASAPIFYNVYRSTTPGFTPGPDTLVAPCVDGTSYVDPFGLQPTFDYYYVVRAEDSSFGGGGLCQNGAEDLNSVELSITTSSGCSTTPNRVPVLTVTSTDGTNKLRWVTPPTGSSLTIRFSDVSPPVTEADGQELVPLSAFTPNSKGFIDHTGLNNDTSYFYGAFVFNGEDKYATATSTSGRPEDTLAATNPVKWVYSTGATSLTAPGIGSVYVVSNDNIVHSMNPLDGDWPPLWKPFFRMKEPAQGRPSVLPIPIAGASKALFPGSQDGHVYAVNGLTGESLWRKRITTEDVQAAPGGLFTAFGGSYNLVLVGTKNTLSDNVFYALNPDTGSVAWSFDNGGGIGIISGQASVDYSNRRVYFASYAGLDPNTLWCLDFDSSGASLGWAQPLGNIGGSPVLYKGKIYVGTTGGVVYALDADDGAILWSRPLGDGAVKGFIWPDFGANRLYLSTDGMVWALRDLSTGSSIDWSVPISGPSVPLLVPNTKYIYVGSGDGNFYQLDRTQLPPTSKSVMLGATPATVGAASMDVVNSMLFVGTSTGAIYAIVFPFP